MIGPGRFAREFAEELVRHEEVRAVAVASRDREKAQDFASSFGFERAYGSYAELFADSAVEIVYIVVPHVFHAGIAEEAIRAGKAVLCEKPLTADPATTRELVSLARERGVFLMEAMKTGFLPAIRAAKSWIDAGRIGEVRLARADFCFSGPADPGDRLMNPDLGGGAVLDVGIYPLYLARALLGEIRSVSAQGSLTPTGVEDSAAILTRHRSGAAAVLTCSFRTEEAMGASIFGTEGSIEIPLFHAAKEARLIQNGRVVERFEDGEAGMVKAEITAVMDAVRRGWCECPGHTHEDSMRLAELMHEIRCQLGSARP